MTDAEEFDEFYTATCRRVIGQIYILTGDLAAAEDAAAEAFTRAWQRWGTVRRSDSAEAWVRMVAARVAINSWRKSANRWEDVV